MSRCFGAKLPGCEAAGSRLVQGRKKKLLQGSAGAVSARMGAYGLHARGVHGWVHVSDDDVQRVQADALLGFLRLNRLELQSHQLRLLFQVGELGK